jgi:hypothetical protein
MWDTPAEREAIIVSKSVAQAILGAEVVKEFVEAQIVDGSDREEWEFFRAPSSSASCNILSETDSLAKKYRPQLV